MNNLVHFLTLKVPGKVPSARGKVSVSKFGSPWSANVTVQMLSQVTWSLAASRNNKKRLDKVFWNSCKRVDTNKLLQWCRSQTKMINFATRHFRIRYKDKWSIYMWSDRWPSVDPFVCVTLWCLTRLWSNITLGHKLVQSYASFSRVSDSDGCLRCMYCNTFLILRTISPSSHPSFPWLLFSSAAFNTILRSFHV